MKWGTTVVSMYVCMYVMYPEIVAYRERVDICVNVCMYVCINICMKWGTKLYACMYVSMRVCMYVIYPDFCA
jgi:hypothetical protein